MHITTLTLDDEALLALTGPLDGSLAPALHVAVDEAIGGGARVLVIDLADVPSVDEGGIAVLAATAHRLGHGGGRLVLHLPDGSTTDVRGADAVRSALGV